MLIVLLEVTMVSSLIFYI